MGSIYKLSCTCGYSKQLNVGGGLASCNINTVNMMFSNDKLKAFNRYYKNKEVKSFFIENELSLCNECKEIITIAVLRFELIDNKKMQIINKCFMCNNKVQILSDLVTCPKCGKVMIKEDIGDWD